MKLETKSVLAAAIPSLISMVFVIAMFYLTIGQDIIRKKYTNHIKNEALKGNKIALLISKNSYMSRYEDKKVIEQALKGNENALEILGIKEEYEKIKKEMK